MDAVNFSYTQNAYYIYLYNYHALYLYTRIVQLYEPPQYVTPCNIAAPPRPLIVYGHPNFV